MISEAKGNQSCRLRSIVCGSSWIIERAYVTGHRGGWAVSVPPYQCIIVLISTDPSFQWRSKAIFVCTVYRSIVLASIDWASCTDCTLLDIGAPKPTGNRAKKESRGREKLPGRIEDAGWLDERALNMQRVKPKDAEVGFNGASRVRLVQIDIESIEVERDGEFFISLRLCLFLWNDTERGIQCSSASLLMKLLRKNLRSINFGWVDFGRNWRCWNIVKLMSRSCQIDTVMCVIRHRHVIDRRPAVNMGRD